MARKICGHISVLSSCYRCEKKANYENHKYNFAGMDNMSEWFINRNSAQFCENALGWRRCNSNAARNHFVKTTGVRCSPKLVEIVKIIEQNYGQDMITPNLHLSLHLYECAKDFEPLYAFWCFSFERINGILGSLPNSHWKIEPELMCRIMNDKQINNIVSSGIVDTKGLDILDTRPSVSSISELDEFTSVEMERYLLYSQNIKESLIAGCEAFPGEMLGPSLEKVIMSSEMLDIMVDYYNATYPANNF
ncbi:hypothetical protein RIR_jg39108.t1 [Rhizophagus irregularis DAOM 181602=DAOM 197198]|nr:hypothetical protein RIR_jg39108.t1 [Rhizophagus irregularis DAOM 181602=DAOM 197198]